MLSSPYFQHTLYSLACLSISINLVSTRRSIQDDKSRASARISILESVKDQLQLSNTTTSPREVQRLMRLARELDNDDNDKDKDKDKDKGRNKVLGDDVSWTDIFSGKPPKVDRHEEEMSKWEREDLEKLRQELK